MDAKNPPASPFKVQVAMKTSLDIYYFDVPCALHCLLDLGNPLKSEEFKKFWEMIAKSNESTYTVTDLYPGYTKGDICANLVTGFEENGFKVLAKVPKNDGTTMLYMGARTINNLPLLLEVPAVANSN